MKILFCCTKKLVKKGYCTYYSEIYYQLKKKFNIDFTSKVFKKFSQISNGYDLIILGFGYTNVGEGCNIPNIINDIDIPIVIILNKEYTGLNSKLNWISEIKPKLVLSVHHKVKEYENKTNIPFKRIMWSCNDNLFKNYNEEYKYDFYFSGIVRKNQTKNYRYKILKDLSKLKKYKLYINKVIYPNNNKTKNKKFLSQIDYAKMLAKSKICLTTTGPADLVGTRYFELMATNRCLIMCNKLEDETIYEKMLIDNFNCVMFSSTDEFFEKTIYYLNNENERMKIVNNAYNYFKSSQNWTNRIENIKNILNSI